VKPGPDQRHVGNQIQEFCVAGHGGLRKILVVEHGKGSWDRSEEASVEATVVFSGACR
jgi:hypothetical protein